MGYLYVACDQISDFCHQYLLGKMWRKCAYMFNVYKNQLSRQTGSRNLTGPKTLPTIWYTYMKLVTKYQISAINSYWEKCDEKYIGRTEGRKDRRKDGRTNRRTYVKQYTPSHFGERGYTKKNITVSFMKKQTKSKSRMCVSHSFNK
jgi:hypothetical protein